MVICEEYISILNPRLNFKQFEENKKNFEKIYETHKNLS